MRVNVRFGSFGAFEDMHDRIRKIGKPTIARINGMAVGGGEDLEIEILHPGSEVELDSAEPRVDAHRFYEREGAAWMATWDREVRGKGKR